MRPRRRVVETDAGFEVACSGFVSSDRVLALAVRDELDDVGSEAFCLSCTYTATGSV